MPPEIYKAEEIIVKLWQAEVLTRQGQLVVDVLHLISVSDAMHHRGLEVWRAEG